MSFSSDVKKELLCAPVKMNCCRKALLLGVLYNAHQTQAKSMEAVFGIKEAAELAVTFLGEVAEPYIREEVRAGRRIYTVGFSSKSVSSFFSRVSYGQSIGEAAKFRCGECAVMFLRGVLISCVSVNDPRKGYHMEVSLSEANGARAEKLIDLFEECGFTPKISKRNGKYSLYFKSNTTISDILSYSGAMKASFEVANTYIERDIRNNENRATNFVAKNISKTVEATQRQISAINKIISSNRFDMLSSELKETAALRLENDDVSLSELALMHEPPISKSGLNHRLEKICREADCIDTSEA